MCDVPSIAVFCSESIECFPGTASKLFPLLLLLLSLLLCYCSFQYTQLVFVSSSHKNVLFNSLDAKLHLICHLLTLEAHHILHVSRIMVKHSPFAYLMCWTPREIASSEYLSFFDLSKTPHTQIVCSFMVYPNTTQQFNSCSL